MANFIIAMLQNVSCTMLARRQSPFITITVACSEVSLDTSSRHRCELPVNTRTLSDASTPLNVLIINALTQRAEDLAPVQVDALWMRRKKVGKTGDISKKVPAPLSTELGPREE